MLKNILYPKNYINILTRSRNIMSLSSLADRKIFNSEPDFTNSIISPPGYYLATTGTQSQPPPPAIRNKKVTQAWGTKYKKVLTQTKIFNFLTGGFGCRGV